MVQLHSRWTKINLWVLQTCLGKPYYQHFKSDHETAEVVPHMGTVVYGCYSQVLTLVVAICIKQLLICLSLVPYFYGMVDNSFQGGDSQRQQCSYVGYHQ
jgi:hypothetical protein